MKLSSNSIVDSQPVPGDYAFCVADADCCSLKCLGKPGKKTCK